ncbi:MAG: NADH-ubiquinone oxidoreductase-F iron-sulfur binding region domain-containing protein, partial [Candidatus Limivicinus sp.]
MSRLSVMTGAKMRTAGETIRGQFVQRIAATPPGVCAVEQTLSILKVCHAQSCGKCVPCRDGLGMLEDIMEDILNNKGTLASLELLKQTAQNIKLSADCAIGFEAANMVLQSLETLDKDFISHVEQHRCVQSFEQPIP